MTLDDSHEALLVNGGSIDRVDGTSGAWAPASPPGPVVDAYGAKCVTGRGPYGAQLTGADAAEA